MTKILIVDDEPENLYLLQVLLSASGFEIELASNGVEALELARRAPPDIVVSDILMPAMDGFALCRAWKEDERLKDTPFIFYTATYTDPKDEAFALSLGADRFIVKPAEPDKFLALMQEIIENHAAGKLVAAPREPVNETNYYKEYNAALIRKLEDKVMQLEQANRALKLDISKRKRAEKALRESQKRVALLAGLLERSSQPFAQAYPDGRVGYFNAAFLDLVGYTREELSLLDWARDLTAPEWQESEQAKLDELNRTGKPVRYEKEYIRKDGSRVPIELLVHLIRGENGQLEYYYGFITDITERKKSEAALAKEQFLLQSLLDNIPDSIYFKDKESCFIRINQAQAERFGLSDPALAIGKNDFAFFSEEHARQAYEDELRIIQTGKPLVNIEEKEIWFDRPDTWVTTTKMPLHNQDGTIIGTFGLSRDITERMLAEQQIQADLKEKAILLREIHHRVKNNLAIISALLEMQAANSLDDRLRAAFKVCQGRILAMAAVHEQLYRSQNLSQIDMLKYVEAIAKGLQASDILSDVKISVTVQDVTLDIDHAIPCGLIINELTTNAMKYAYKNIQNADMQEKKITICMLQEKDSYVLKVNDNGAGLPAELDVKHTKTLGLKLVNRLTGQLKGALELESSRVGTTFTITFPVQA